MKRELLLTIMGLVTMSVIAEPTYLDLNSCRALALKNNKQAQINKETSEAARDLRHAAAASFFPKITANGGYVWTEKNLYLIPDNYTFPFGEMHADGTFVFNDDAISTNLFNYADLREQFPELDQSLTEWVATEYTKVRDMSELDIHHVFVGEVGVTQPLFLGGKLIELYKISKSMEQVADIRQAKENEELLVSVDEAYWRVLSVEQKQKLADKYCTMLRKVVSDLTIAIEEGTATKADLLNIEVRLNEAEVSLAKADHGLRLSKMALCQIIGMPIDSDIHLDDHGLSTYTLVSQQDIDIDKVWQQRREIQMLEETEKIAKSSARMTASTLMPNIVAGAQYVTTNPNLQNGYRDNKQFKGSFQAGVVVNIPIAHADDIYRVKAAKHTAKIAELQLEEAKEKIELQATQSLQHLQEANRKLEMATANISNAEENLRMAQAAFEEGMMTSTELLGAQTAWLKAYSEKIDAAIELRLYETYLKKDTGELRIKN